MTKKYDFFISYNKADAGWAEWIAWQLEEAKYSTKIQLWDFGAGSNFAIEMHQASLETEHTIAVLSSSFLKSEFCAPEWTAAFVQDPTGRKRKLIPVRVHEREPPGMLASIDYIDLVGKAEQAAKDELLSRIKSALQIAKGERAKPSKSPGFPNKRITSEIATPHFPTAPPNIDRCIVIGPKPSFAENFLDREEEQLKLAAAITDPESRIVSVIGRRGIGKTALISKVLHDLENNTYPDTIINSKINGIVYQDAHLGGISTDRLFEDCVKLIDPANKLIAEEIYRSQGLNPISKLTKLLCFLTGGLFIIFFDNFDELLDESGWIKDQFFSTIFETIIKSNHGLRFIAATSVSISFPPELLKYDKHIPLKIGLSPEIAIKLLQKLDINGECGLIKANENILLEIANVTHGIPRALELFVSILLDDPLSSISDAIKRFYKRTNVVNDLIEEVYHKFNITTRDVINALAVLKRPTVIDAVIYVAQGYNEMDVRESIKKLSKSYFVITDRNNGTVYLQKVDQDFAIQTMPSTKLKKLHHLAAEYYHNVKPHKSKIKKYEDLSFFLYEFEHFLNAEEFENAALAISEIDYDYLIRWGHSRRVIKMRNDLEGLIKNPNLTAKHNFSLSAAYWFIGDYKLAEKYSRLAINNYQEVKDSTGETKARISIAETYRCQGEMHNSINEFKKAVESAELSKSKIALANALDGLSHAFRIIGDFNKAINSCKRALKIYKESGDKSLIATSMNSLSLILSAAGRPQEALKYGCNALKYASEIDNLKNEGFSQNYIGCAFLISGQIDKGIAHLQIALEIFRKISYLYGVSFTLNYLGSALLVNGEYDRSIDLLKEGLSVAKSTEEPRGEGYCAFNLARAYRSKKDYANSEKFVKMAIEAFGRANTIHVQAAQLFLSSLQFAEKDQVREATTLIKCVEELERAGDFFMECVNILNETKKFAEKHRMNNLSQRIDLYLKKLTSKLMISPKALNQILLNC